jgi:hypothetical protein
MVRMIPSVQVGYFGKRFHICATELPKDSIRLQQIGMPSSLTAFATPDYTVSFLNADLAVKVPLVD